MAILLLISDGPLSARNNLRSCDVLVVVLDFLCLCIQAVWCLGCFKVTCLDVALEGMQLCFLAGGLLSWLFVVGLVFFLLCVYACITLQIAKSIDLAGKGVWEEG